MHCSTKSTLSWLYLIHSYLFGRCINQATHELSIVIVKALQPLATDDVTLD